MYNQKENQVFSLCKKIEKPGRAVPVFLFLDKSENMSKLSIFKKVAIAEGISYLALLLIAMPLKYFAGMPLAVKYTGWAHGLLFVLYVALVIMCWMEYKWKFGKTLLVLVCSLLPFAPFIIEKRLHEGAENEVTIK
jgi:integral membrane protein